MTISSAKIEKRLKDALVENLGDTVMVSLHHGRNLNQRGRKMIGLPKVTLWGKPVVFKFDEDKLITWSGIWSQEGELLIYTRPDWRNSPINLTRGSTLTITPRISVFVA